MSSIAGKFRVDDPFRVIFSACLRPLCLHTAVEVLLGSLCRTRVSHGMGQPASKRSGLRRFVAVSSPICVWSFIAAATEVSITDRGLVHLAVR